MPSFNSVGCLWQVLLTDSEKHNDDVISCCWDLKIPNFVKLYIDYHPSKFQISWLSGSNFMEVSVRHKILPLFLVMTSFVIVELSNLRIL